MGAPPLTDTRLIAPLATSHVAQDLAATPRSGPAGTAPPGARRASAARPCDGHPVQAGLVLHRAGELEVRRGSEVVGELGRGRVVVEHRAARAGAELAPGRRVVVANSLTTIGAPAQRRWARAAGRPARCRVSAATVLPHRVRRSGMPWGLPRCTTIDGAGREVVDEVGAGLALAVSVIALMTTSRGPAAGPAACRRSLGPTNSTRDAEDPPEGRGEVGLEADDRPAVLAVGAGRRVRGVGGDADHAAGAHVGRELLVQGLVVRAPGAAGVRRHRARRCRTRAGAASGGSPEQGARVEVRASCAGSVDDGGDGQVRKEPATARAPVGTK